MLLSHMVLVYLAAEDVLEALSAGDEVPLETLAGDSVTATMVRSQLQLFPLLTSVCCILVGCAVHSKVGHRQHHLNEHVFMDLGQDL